MAITIAGTKESLLLLAAEEKVDVAKSWTKTKIIEAIDAARQQTRTKTSLDEIPWEYMTEEELRHLHFYFRPLAHELPYYYQGRAYYRCVASGYSPPLARPLADLQQLAKDYHVLDLLRQANKLENLIYGRYSWVEPPIMISDMHLIDGSFGRRIDDIDRWIFTYDELVLLLSDWVTEKSRDDNLVVAHVLADELRDFLAALDAKTVEEFVRANLETARKVFLNRYL